MRLSKRLELLLSFVEPGGRVADVGTDHGFIPVELVRRAIAYKAIAMDVRPGPLLRAREHIRQAGLWERIETRLGDGVKRLSSGEADTVVIAGMGGQLVIHILENGRRLWGDVRHWILSPQSELDKVRRFLYDRGFELAREDMVEDEGKYYTVMDAVYRGDRSWEKALTEAEYLYGPKLIGERNQVLMEFLEREERQLLGIMRGLEGKEGEKAQSRREELGRKVEGIRYLLNPGNIPGMEGKDKRQL